MRLLYYRQLWAAPARPVALHAVTAHAQHSRHASCSPGAKTSAPRSPESSLYTCTEMRHHMRPPAQATGTSMLCSRRSAAWMPAASALLGGWPLQEMGAREGGWRGTSASSATKLQALQNGASTEALPSLPPDLNCGSSTAHMTAAGACTPSAACVPQLCSRRPTACRNNAER